MITSDLSIDYISYGKKQAFIMTLKPELLKNCMKINSDATSMIINGEKSNINAIRFVVTS